MSWTLRRSEKAIEDLTDIHDYIAADNPVAADRLIKELLALFDRTADFPEMGHAADDRRPGLRLLTRGNYLLIYHIVTDERSVELIRVVHGARDWSSLIEG